MYSHLITPADLLMALLLGPLLVAGVCKEDQTKICRSIATGNPHHPNAGTCIAKRYISFTHVCSVNEYSSSILFCCCSTQTTSPAAAAASGETAADAEATDTTLCCRYFQAWNIFRCDEVRDAVPLAASNSSMEIIQVWTIVLVVLAVLSATAFILVRCLKKKLANRKNSASIQKQNCQAAATTQRQQLSDFFPVDQHFQQQQQQQKCCQEHFLRQVQLFHDKGEVVPLTPTAPLLHEFESTSRRTTAAAACRHNQKNAAAASPSSNRPDPSIKQSARLSAEENEATKPSMIPEAEKYCALVDDHDSVTADMLRSSLSVEEEIQINNEPPPSYDEAMRSCV